MAGDPGGGAGAARGPRPLPPHAAALLGRGRVRPACVSISPTCRRSAAPSRRWCGKRRFDVSEMAIATFLQAKAWGKPLVLLPRDDGGAVPGGGAALPRRQRHRRPRRLGRPPSRGARLQPDHRALAARHPRRRLRRRPGGGALDHVRGRARRRVPRPGLGRAGAGRPGHAGDAACGRAGRGDRRQRRAGRPAFAHGVPGPGRRRRGLRRRHGFVPVNHLVTVRRELAERRPDLVAELLRMFRDAQAAAGPAAAATTADRPRRGCSRRSTSPGDMRPSRACCRGRSPPEEVWDGLPADA